LQLGQPVPNTLISMPLLLMGQNEIE
jgi:hypothetical protein